MEVGGPGVFHCHPPQANTLMKLFGQPKHAKQQKTCRKMRLHQFFSFLWISSPSKAAFNRRIHPVLLRSAWSKAGIFLSFTSRGPRLISCNRGSRYTSSDPRVRHAHAVKAVEKYQQKHPHDKDHCFGSATTNQHQSIYLISVYPVCCDFGSPSKRCT